jgi:hypothetical protein
MLSADIETQFPDKFVAGEALAGIECERRGT